jgi:hypothetical protein
MSRLDEVAERDGWRCWLCDEHVDPDMSVNDPRGASVDSMNAGTKGAKGARSSGARGKSDSETGERLAHRGCNTKKGAVAPVVAWPDRFFVADPAPLFAVAERLERKGGREVVARCPSRSDADEVADWLVDRFSRLIRAVPVTASIEPGGGQFLIALSADRR